MGGPKPRPPTERFWEKVDKQFGEEACWLWLGALTEKGYGVFSEQGLAHRFSYQEIKGKIPEGLVVDHLCRVPRCVNPDHLRLVSNKENVQSGLKGRLVTHCPKGHPYNKINTLIHHGRRECKTCHREWNRAAYRRKTGKSG